MARGLTVRRAVPEDAAAIASISIRGWARAFRGLVPDAYLDGRSAEAEARAWAAYLEAEPPENRTWVAERDGAVAGFLRCGPAEEGAAEIHGFYVDPELRGQGLGRTLLAHALEDLRGRGFARVRLWTFAGNEPTEAFYARAGFRREGEPRRWVEGPHAAEEVRYARTL